MNPSVVLEDCLILEFAVRPYNRKDGTAAEFRECTIRYNGKMLKLSVGKDVNLSDKIDKSYELIVDLVTYGDSMQPSLRVSGIGSKAK